MAREFTDAQDLPIDPVIRRWYRSVWALRHKIVPFALQEGVLLAYGSADTDRAALESLARMKGCQCAVVAVEAARLQQLLKRIDEITPASETGPRASEPPVAFEEAPSGKGRLQALVLEALQKQVTDIHLQPEASGMCVRWRRHGDLHTRETLEQAEALALAQQVKLLGSMDLDEKRRPQDGRFTLVGADIRVSLLPCTLGESLVLRLHPHHTRSPALADLGMSKEQSETVRKALQVSGGLALVTGPTGSGKTTTLYSLLATYNPAASKILTLEDPIERTVPGLTQIALSARPGMTFAAALRGLLRQSPNVIMVGEIRDPETLQIALQAAHTGHTVLSTLHTQDALTAITRLEDLGAGHQSLAAALRLIIAQRLVRLRSPEDEATVVGRVGVFEILPVSEQLRMQISNREGLAAYRKTLEAEGHMSLYASAQALAAANRISDDELNRLPRNGGV